MDPRTQAQMQHVQNKKEYVAKQQRWLLFLRHCAKCTAPEGQCTYGQSCTVAKQLWRHILTCADPNCEYPRCMEFPAATSTCPACAIYQIVHSLSSVGQECCTQEHQDVSKRRCCGVRRRIKVGNEEHQGCFSSKILGCFMHSLLRAERVLVD